MKTTRDADLELLELARDKEERDGMRNRQNAILESVWLQAKDSTLEKIREELAYWINYGMTNSPDEGVQPTQEQIQAMGEAEMNIERLEKVAQEYARSPGFQQAMLKRMSNHDPVRAQVIAQKQKRRLL